MHVVDDAHDVKSHNSATELSDAEHCWSGAVVCVEAGHAAGVPAAAPAAVPAAAAAQSGSAAATLTRAAASTAAALHPLVQVLGAEVNNDEHDDATVKLAADAANVEEALVVLKNATKTQAM